jgi:hypothetical protein
MGVGTRPRTSRSKPGSPLLPQNGWAADQGIVDRMRDYRDWWNIPARRPSGPR